MDVDNNKALILSNLMLYGSPRTISFKVKIEKKIVSRKKAKNSVQVTEIHNLHAVFFCLLDIMLGICQYDIFSA